MLISAREKGYGMHQLVDDGLCLDGVASQYNFNRRRLIVVRVVDDLKERL